ncbi:unnamed protein product [Boreogadus saida]
MLDTYTEAMVSAFSVDSTLSVWKWEGDWEAEAPAWTGPDICSLHRKSFPKYFPMRDCVCRCFLYTPLCAPGSCLSELDWTGSYLGRNLPHTEKWGFLCDETPMEEVIADKHGDGRV